MSLLVKKPFGSKYFFQDNFRIYTIHGAVPFPRLKQMDPA